MASNACLFSCQVTACDKKFHSLRALVSHMNLQHSGDKCLGLHCNIDNCSVGVCRIVVSHYSAIRPNTNSVGG